MENIERWTLHVEFDGAVPEERDEYVKYLCEFWGIDDDDELKEFVEWTDTEVTTHVNIIDCIFEPYKWLLLNTIPKKVTLTRNEDRDP